MDFTKSTIWCSATLGVYRLAASVPNSSCKHAQLHLVDVIDFWSHCERSWQQQTDLFPRPADVGPPDSVDPTLLHGAVDEKAALTQLSWTAFGKSTDGLSMQILHKNRTDTLCSLHAELVALAAALRCSVLGKPSLA